MIDWTPYLESICTKYAQWWDVYTLTDVEGKTRLLKTAPLLTDLRVQSIEREREKPGEREEKIERFTVLEGLRKYAINHVLLIGRPGSGKSTALARLLLEESEANLEPLPQPLSYKERGVQHQLSATSEKLKKVELPPASGGLRGVKIPILVELRYYQTSIFDLILQFLQRHESTIDRNILENLLLGHNNFTPLLLFDGINELPSDEARRDLQQFRQQYPKIPMIFTTRDIGIGGDLNIEKKLEMLPLNESQMCDFVKAYLPEKSEKMLKQLGTRLKEFGQTPLLLWMLCSVFESNDSQIPANLGLVFQRFTEIYDHRLKADVPTYQESRGWWRELLQILAWKMTKGDSKTEIHVAISQREAEAVLKEFLQKKVEYPDNCAKQWLKDLLKHHLIQLESNNQIAFRHQLIQEYYTAEALLEKLPHLSDEELQWHYLNYLKWTEPVALMAGLIDKEAQVIQLVKCGLKTDWKLGARLAGAVNPQWQKEAVRLVHQLNIPMVLKVNLLGYTSSNEAVKFLEEALTNESEYVRYYSVEALGNICTEDSMYLLYKAFEDKSIDYIQVKIIKSLEKIGNKKTVIFFEKLLDNNNVYFRRNAIDALETISINGSKIAIYTLIKALKDTDSYVYLRACYALTQITRKSDIIDALEHLQESGFEIDKILTSEDIKTRIKYYGNGMPRQKGKTIKFIDNPDIWLKKIGDDRSIETLHQALFDEDASVRMTATCYLSQDISNENESDRELRIKLLFEALKDKEETVLYNALSGLEKIGDLNSISQLKDLFCSSDDLIHKFNWCFWDIIHIIQQRFRTYKANLSTTMSKKQVYISYNWQEDSNEMANKLVQAFANKGIAIIRDKTHTTYKDSIKNFMQQIGQGKCVVAVISDSYLKSENCMFELVEIARNGDFYDRIFPIVLPDAKIHKDLDRIDYLEYWEQEKAKLQAKYKQIDLVKTNSILETLNLYDEIRRNIDNLTNILKDMNTLTPDLHRESEFEAMIQAIETKLAEDGQNIPNATGKTSSSSSTQSQVKSESKYNIHAKNVQIIEQGDGKIQDSSS